MAGMSTSTQQLREEHCGILAFQNLATGTVQTNDPSTASTALDLSSPTLTRKLCPDVTAPVQAPVSGDQAAPLARGLVTSDGRFQIVSDYDVSYLQECGTRLKQFLTYTCELYPCAPAANSRAVIWQSKPGRLTGVLLPSLKRFDVDVPAKVDPSAAGATMSETTPMSSR
jgi:hypothetical protein